MKWGSKIINVALFLFALAYVWQGFSYSRTPRLFPLMVGIPMLFLTAFQTVIDFFPRLSKKYAEMGTIDAEMLAGRAKNEVKEEDPKRTQKELEAFLWLALAVGLIMLLGIFWAIPLFIFVFLKLRYSRGWFLSLALPLGTLVTMYLLFIKLFQIPLYKGWFFEG